METGVSNRMVVTLSYGGKEGGSENEFYVIMRH